MISITVVFMGPARDFAGVDEASIGLGDGASVAELRALLAERYPGLKRGLATIRFAVNEEFASDGDIMQEGDEVALIPPVCGGAHEDTLVRTTDTSLDIGAVRDFVSGDPSVGAIVTFEGTTRRESSSDGGELLHLDYEAYEAMALKELEKLAQEVRNRYSAARVAIVHRVGSVPVGESAVVIAVGCGHRSEAFEACRWIIDTLKEDVPIWKKNVYDGGREDWVDPGEVSRPK